MKKYLFNKIEITQTYTFPYTISEDVFNGFINLFKDNSAIHIDQKYAVSHGFEGKVMHGAILNGFISHFIGCVFPGNNSMILSLDIKYHKPVYLNEMLELRMEVIQRVESLKVIVLSFEFMSNIKVIKSTGKLRIVLRDD